MLEVVPTKMGGASSKLILVNCTLQYFYAGGVSKMATRFLYLIAILNLTDLA